MEKFEIAALVAEKFVVGDRMDLSSVVEAACFGWSVACTGVVVQRVICRMDLMVVLS